MLPVPADVGAVVEQDLLHLVRTPDELAANRQKQIMMNVANPAEAFYLSLLPNNGVGLQQRHRMRAHVIADDELEPRQRPEQVADVKERRDIERLTRGYADKGQYFVDRLAEGVAMIAAAFWVR